MSAALDLYLYTDPFYEDPSLKIIPKPSEKPEELLADSLDIKGHAGLSVFDFGGFKPRDYQASLFRELLSRENLEYVFWVLPRRAGKTEIMVIYLIIRALLKAPVSKVPYLKYGLLYPDLASGKEAAWEKIKQRTKGLPELRLDRNNGRADFVLTGAKGQDIEVSIQIIGLQDMDKRRGRGYDGLVADECAYLPPGWRPIIRPMLSDFIKQPTFLVNISTPEETGDFWEFYDKYKLKEDSGDLSYHTMWLNTDKLKHITPRQLEALKLELSMEEFAIEYGCKRGINISGRIFAEECTAVERRGGVGQINDDRSQQKWMACDIGSSKRDFFAMWIFQLNYTTGMWEAIDYNQIASADEDKIFKWVQSRGHNIGQIILPFDGERGFPTPRATLQSKFPQAKVDCLPKVQKVERIRYARTVFPRVCFNQNQTNVGWNCLQRYSRVRDNKTKIMTINPKHDKYSHGADAFTYFATGVISGLLDVNLNNLQYKMREFRDYNKRVIKSSEPMEDFIKDMGG